MGASFLQLGFAIVLAGVALLLLITVWWAVEFWRNNSALQQFPWVDVNREERFPKFKAFLRGFSNARDVIERGYEEYSKKGKMFVTIDQTGRPQVFISPAHLEEALKFDGTALDEHSFFPMTIAEKYTFGGYGQPIGINGQHVVCIRGLTRNMHRLSEDLSDETQYALGKYWGHEAEWKEVKLVETCKFLTGAVTSRMLVGQKLCRNEEYLDVSLRWNNSLMLTAGLINLFPDSLQPIVAPLLMIHTKRLTDQGLKFLAPPAQNRIADRKTHIADKSAGWEEPYDYMKFLLDEPSGFNNCMDNDPIALARGVMMINAAAFFASAYGVVNALLDILSAPAELDLVAKLRAECAAVARDATDNLTSKVGINKLLHLDSVVRESMRYNALDYTAMHRYVKPAEGFTFSSGEHLPQGTHLVFPSGPYQHEDELYPDGDKFEPFRFSEAKDDAPMHHVNGPVSAVSTGKYHFPWGIGKSQCPGRFFAVHEIKIILAHILLNYDMKPLQKRPANTPIGTFALPDEKVTISIRRRVPEKIAS
ncbi:cytochrome P450 [Macrophomina phaseolina]|uniref:Cytochrome P450 n=1 Tax=Macrophomina phaseolina TaxID=35725 RepID=A0ABQ8GBD7_9PEZI|nr:cytochrome P450 [Macrophomina phaseolina]